MGYGGHLICRSVGREPFLCRSKMRLVEVNFGCACGMQVPLAVVQEHPMYPHLLAVLLKKITVGKMRARQLANTLWAFGKLGHDAEDLVDALLYQLQRVRHLCSSQQFS